MASPVYRRRKKLIKPRFQLKVAVACLGIALMAVLVLMILINEAIMDFADKGWVDAVAIQKEWLGVLLGKLGLALAVLAPMTLALGIILMHRIAGPLYRFEQFVNAVVRGEHPAPCRIRKGDELVDFCDLLNRLTEPLRDGRVDLTPFAEAVGHDQPQVPTPEEAAAPAVTLDPAETEAA